MSQKPGWEYILLQMPRDWPDMALYQVPPPPMFSSGKGNGKENEEQAASQPLDALHELTTSSAPSSPQFSGATTVPLGDTYCASNKPMACSLSVAG